MSLERMVVPFRRWHYGWLANELDLHVSDDELAQMERFNSWTGVMGGEILVCAGTIPFWPGRCHAWAYMTPKTGPHMRWITNEVKKNLAQIKGRIEMSVHCEFPAGHRWARLLGFKIEAERMEGYGPDGAAHALYARVNHA
jgi:hypothetical protein